MVLLVVASCQHASDPGNIRPPDEQLTWVAKLYVGGMQCDPTDIYTPPDVRHVLNQVGIPVYETTIEYYGVCAACGCPSYAAMHYARIKREQLARAEQMGFEQKNPPPAG